MNQMTEQDVIDLHYIARTMESGGAGNQATKLRDIADRLSIVLKTQKQVEESWKHL